MNKTVNLVDLKPQYEDIKEDLWKEWEKIFESMQLMLGPNMQAFEKEFSEYTGVKSGAGVDSGTAALFLSLKAMEIGDGDAVISPSFTFFATIEAIIQTGALPALIDVDENTYNISSYYLKKYIDNNTIFDGKNLIEKSSKRKIKAVIPVHLYGNPVEMDEINKIADKYNLKVLEDCAQAHGAEYKDKKIGSFGDMSAYSFYFSKNLSALGEGGIILSNNEDYINKVKMLRVHGQSDKYTHEMIGYNSRLDEMQAVVLRLKLKKLEEWNNKRIEAAEYYNKKLSNLPLKLPLKNKNSKHVYHLYVVRTEKRDELFKYLKDNGVGAGIHYPVPSHEQPALKFLEIDKKSLENTEKVAKQIISLPMYPHLKKEDIDYVVKKIKDFFNK